MIWSGVALYRDTGRRAYRDQAKSTAAAVERYLSDGRGVFTDLQAENDVVEPLIEGMLALAQDGQRAARAWVLANAAAALSARTQDGSFGRFFDGPPPATTVTAWQTNGGLAVEIAASAIAPRTPSTPDEPLGRRRRSSAVRSARFRRPSGSTDQGSHCSERSDSGAARPVMLACSSTGARRSTARASGRTNPAPDGASRTRSCSPGAGALPATTAWHSSLGSLTRKKAHRSCN